MIVKNWLKALSFLFGFLIPFTCVSQSFTIGSDSDGFHFGIAAKLSAGFCLTQNPNFKLSITGAAGYNFEKAALFPTLHTGVIVFNRGPIGSNLSRRNYELQNHAFAGLMLTGKFGPRKFDYHDRYVPLYHFADFTANPLQNPYESESLLSVLNQPYLPFLESVTSGLVGLI